MFPGTGQEREALMVAVAGNCACPRHAERVLAVCTAHALLLDQAVLKRLVFYRRWGAALRRGEHLENPRWGD